MKILKIFGVVVGIHVFALILIFANPGCSSTSKPPPSPEDTVTKAPEPAPMVTLPVASAPAPAADLAPAPSFTPVPASFNPDAPAAYGSSGPTIRFTPTRPNTPAANAVQAQPVENVTPVTTHIVKSGDSLWTLGKKYHLDYKQIAAANNLSSSATLHEGQKLIIPGKAPSSGAAAAPAAATSSGSSASAAPVATKSDSAPAPGASKRSTEDFKYVVKSGESLGTIAKKFGVTVRDIAVANSIKEPQKVRAGTELTIPGWKSTSGGSKAADASKAASASAPAPAPKPAINVIDTEQPPPAPANSVPVIKIDDSPLTPAPKQP